MSKIPSNSSRPDPAKAQQKQTKGTSDAQETQAAAQAASAQAGTISAKELKSILIAEFGEKVGTEAYNMLAQKAKAGDKIDFATIRSAVLAAGAKHNQGVTDDQLGSLKTDLDNAAAPEQAGGNSSKPRGPRVDYNPVAHLEARLIQMKESNKAIAALEDEKVARELQMQLAQDAQRKEMDQEDTGRLNKLRNPDRYT